MTIRIPSKEERQYVVDPTRKSDLNQQSYPKRIGTGVTVVAQTPGGGMCNVDIAQLDAESLNRYLRSKGGRNDLAEDIVRSILGHPLSRPE